MLTSSSSTRNALAERTNLPSCHGQPSPPRHVKRRNPGERTSDLPKKKARIFFQQSQPPPALTIPDDDSTSDVEMTDTHVPETPYRTIARARGLWAMSQAWRVGDLRFRPMALPSRPILESFVSHSSFDNFPCPASATNELTPPYACAYSHSAKNGHAPILAVATEQGSVHIFNTAHNRSHLSVSTQTPRATLQSHANGIFDVKWRADDLLIATASGDQSVCISNVESQLTVRTLRGHTGTVKCVSWSPHHPEMLASGSRDGSVCLWDLRIPDRTNAVVGSSMTMDGVTEPSLKIDRVHGEEKKGVGRRKKESLRTVTSVLHLPEEPWSLVTSGSFDGRLSKWDMRLPVERGSHSKAALKAIATSFDPTTLGSPSGIGKIDGAFSRARGICSLALGHGPSAGLVFGLGADSRIHTYSDPFGLENDSDAPVFSHPQLKGNSFYVRVSVSPCGRWLASGSAGGSAFLWDVSRSGVPHRARAWIHPSNSQQCWTAGVQLPGRAGEVGAVDWAEGALAACADDGVVRIWRPDVDVLHECLEDPEERAWHWSWANMA